MRRLLARLARMDRAELAWRAVVEARCGWDRARAALRQPRWDRRELRSRLAQDGGLDAIRRALYQERWLDAHRALSQYFAAAPQRFPLHRARKDMFVAGLRRRFPDAARQATAR